MTETIQIDGMSCGGCVNSVRLALGRAGLSAEEVKEVKIGEATVEFDETRLTRQRIIEAIEDAGFDVKNRE
jgi:copper chaperone